jgi:hypothetical protein
LVRSQLIQNHLEDDLPKYVDGCERGDGDGGLVGLLSSNLKGLGFLKIFGECGSNSIHIYWVTPSRRISRDFGYRSTYGILLRNDDEDWFKTHATIISLGFIPLFHHLSSVVDKYIINQSSLDLQNDEKSPPKKTVIRCSLKS